MKTGFAFAALALAATALPAAARTVTLTFDSVPRYEDVYEDLEDGVLTPVVEKGFHIRNADGMGAATNLAYYNAAGTIHLDDSGTDFARAVSFDAGGLRFSALSSVVIGLGQEAFIINDEGETVGPVPYDNLRFEGFRDGALVATSDRSTGAAGGVFTFLLGADFADLDRLTITNIGPFGQYWEGHELDCMDAPCGHVNLDSLTLDVAAVPLPAALPLAVAGLGALATLRRRRR